jgi:hypothetical protein
LLQAAPFAVDKLEELMEYAESEPVKLKAATEILDRAGVRGGYEVDSTVNVEMRPAAEIIAERLDRLAAGAISTAARLAEAGLHVQPDKEIIDAEVVTEETGTAGSETFNEPSNEEERPALLNQEDR